MADEPRYRYFIDLVTGEVMIIRDGLHLNSNPKEEIDFEEYLRLTNRDPNA